MYRYCIIERHQNTKDKSFLPCTVAYLHIDVVFSLIWSHNVMVSMIVYTYTFRTVYVARMAACQIKSDSGGTNLDIIINACQIIMIQPHDILIEVTHCVSSYDLYQREVERTFNSTRTVFISAGIDSCKFIGVVVATSWQSKEPLHFILR